MKRTTGTAGTTRLVGMGSSSLGRIPGLSQALRAADAGDMEAAIAGVEDILTAGEADAKGRVVLRKMLIDWNAEIGEASECKRLASLAAEDARATLGQRHEITLIARHSELYWMCMTGYDEVARRRFPQLIRDVEKVLGPTDPLAWAVRTNSAMPLKRGGDFSGAARVYRRLLSDMAGVLRPTDLAVLTTRDNLAEVLALKGDYGESTRLYESLLEDLLGITRPGDRRVLRLRDEIASNAFCSGDIERARELWGVLAEDCRRHLGECDPETARQRTLQVALSVQQDDAVGVVRWCRLLLDNLPDGFEQADVDAFRAMMREYEDRGDVA